MYGVIPAGLPADQQEQPDGYIALDAKVFPVSASAKIFGLRVRGDSMVNAHILDGDYVVVEVREPRHSEIVAALIDGETTLKRYLIEDGQALLRAENPDYEDIRPHQDLFIQGVLLAVLRGCMRNQR
jgi:repressor LexA